MQPSARTEVIFIGGRSGVGKTTVAAELSRLLRIEDIPHALIEGDNLHGQKGTTRGNPRSVAEPNQRRIA